MTHLSLQSTDPELEQLTEQFNHWRAKRSSPREPIPQRLWDAAARLSRRLVVSRVAKTLRLSPGDLKRRRDGWVESARREPEETTPDESAVFVPVIAPEGIPTGNVEVEVHRVDGSRLCLRYSGSAPVAELMRAFLAG